MHETGEFATRWYRCQTKVVNNFWRFSRIKIKRKKLFCEDDTLAVYKFLFVSSRLICVAVAQAHLFWYYSYIKYKTRWWDMKFFTTPFYFKTNEKKSTEMRAHWNNQTCERDHINQNCRFKHTLILCVWVRKKVLFFCIFIKYFSWYMCFIANIQHALLVAVFLPPTPHSH